MIHGKQCGICDGEKIEGIHVCHFFICKDCEMDMIHTEPEDVKYHYYVRRLRYMKESIESKYKHSV